MSERMKSRVWENNRRTLLQYILHVNSKVGRQHTKAPLAAALSPFMSLLHPPNPWCEWCDVCRLTNPLRSTSPTLLEQWCRFFYVPQEPDKCNCCETGPTVFRTYPRRLESLTVCRCHYKGSTFFFGHNTGVYARGGWGTWVFFGWVCAARDSELAPRSKKNFP